MSLTALLLLFAPPVFSAPTAALSAQEIARYQAQLSDARIRQSAVGAARECLTSRDAALVARRDASQVRLGEMRRREQDLRATVAREQAASDGYRETLRNEERNLDRLHGELRSLQATRAAQESEVRDCKARWWAPDFMCDFSNSIAHLIGLFDNVDQQIRTSERKVNNARDGMNQARSQSDQSQARLDQAVSEATVLDSEIRRTESEIGTVQAELSALRVQAQAHQSLLDEFTDALAQAAQINTDDGRARTARQLRDAARRFDAGASQLATAVAHASKILPAESAVCIRR